MDLKDYLFYQDDWATIYCGDCLEVMRIFPENLVDSSVTDPPYEIGFMGKAWDKTGIAYNIDMWKEVLRVLKPGGFLLSFGGTRTYHRMACAIEDAGFEIRDMVEWIYGSGFPKSLDISKAIDKQAGTEREKVGFKKIFSHIERGDSNINNQILKSTETQYFGENQIKKELFETAPATTEAKQWSGWGTALKPAHEPICMARKPLSEKTVAENVLKWGMGGININECRVEYEDNCRLLKGGTYGGNRLSGAGTSMFGNGEKAVKYGVIPEGRWPANLIHDGSEEALGLFPNVKSGGVVCKTDCGNSIFGKRPVNTIMNTGDSGSAARFFYCAKASKSERDRGCEGMEEVLCGMVEDDAYPIKTGSGNLRETKRHNNHPTVKPLALMEYLIKLIIPPNGIVLDNFMGSGSTGKAAILQGFHFIGIEINPKYCEIAVKRLRQEVFDFRKSKE